jgi:cytochrome c
MPPPVVAKLSGATGLHDVYLVFKNEKAPAGQALFVRDRSGIPNASVGGNEHKTGSYAGFCGSRSMPAQDLEAYTGKYKMSGLPFEYIEITPKEGRLSMQGG